MLVRLPPLMCPSIVTAPLLLPCPLQWGQHVAVCGEGPLFGDWDVKK